MQEPWMQGRSAGVLSHIKEQLQDYSAHATQSGILFRLVGIISLALAVSACSSDTNSHIIPRERGSACLVSLSYHASAFDTAAKKPGMKTGCSVETPVSLSGTQVSLSRPALMDCTLALRFSAFEAASIQPLAREIFHQEVKVYHHYGAYACRGRSSNRKRLSEHSYGKALDIGVFELSNGTRISVAKDWKGAGKKTEFLRKLSQSACKWFSVVLTPNSDRDHHDHLHLDIGPWKKCGI